MYKNRDDPLDVNKYYSCIQIFWYMGYGGWTIYNIGVYFVLPPGCTDTMILSMLNWEVAMFIGILPASACIIFVIMILVIVPLILY